MSERRDLPEIPEADAKLLNICLQRLRTIYPEKIDPRYLHQLRWELSALKRTRTSSIFLIVRKLLSGCGLQPYEIGFRGTLGSSLVAYLCGLTCIDPLNQWTRLYPEFCMGYDGEQEPDIELMLPEKFIEQARKECASLPGISDAFRPGCTGIDGNPIPHPSAVMLVPEGHTISEYTALIDRDGTVFSTVDNFSFKALYRLTLAASGYTDFIYELSRKLKIRLSEIPLDDQEVFNLLHHEYPSHHNAFKLNAAGCPEFDSVEANQLAVCFWPENYSELVKLCGMMHSTFSGDAKFDSITIQKDIPKKDMIACREDVFENILKSGIERRRAFEIAEFIRRGKATNEKFSAEWLEIVNELNEAHIPEAFIDVCTHIRYLFPRAHVYRAALNAYWGAWFKIYHPQEFYDTYFKICAPHGLKMAVHQGRDGLLNYKAAFEDLQIQQEEDFVQEDEMIQAPFQIQLAEEMFRNGFYLSEEDCLV